MNQWSRTRKRIILFIVILFTVGMIGLPAFLLFYNAPTCFDGRQNGDETGIDCGGSCELLCRAESLPLILKGDPRVLTLNTNTYQVAALIENSNSDAEIYRAGYTIRIYDATGIVPLYIIDSETYVPKGDAFAIFEGPFTLPEGVIPRRAVLEWKNDTIIWRKNNIPIPELIVKGRNFSRLNDTPRLEAVVENPTLNNISNIDVVALLSDVEGNIFAASKTFIEAIPAGGEGAIIFTWPKPFSAPVANTDIIIRILPDRSFIR